MRIGVAGPAGAATLIKYAMRCGIGNSLRAVRTQTARLGALVGRYRARPGGARSRRRGAELDGVVGLHFFPFGGVAKTAKWLAQARGR